MIRESLVLALALGAAAEARAASIVIDTDQTDLSFSLGTMAGTISSSANKAAKTEDVGGATFGVVAHFDYNSSWAGYVGPEMAMDAQTHDVLRKGLAGGIYYYLAGGAKKVSHEVYNASIVQRRAYGVAALGKSAYQAYAARDPAGKVAPITGAVIENSVGLDFRKDLGTDMSIGIQFSTTVLVMPASVEGVQTKMTNAGFYWRTYL